MNNFECFLISDYDSIDHHLYFYISVLYYKLAVRPWASHFIWNMNFSFWFFFNFFHLLIFFWSILSLKVHWILAIPDFQHLFSLLFFWHKFLILVLGINLTNLNMNNFSCSKSIVFFSLTAGFFPPIIPPYNIYYISNCSSVWTILVIMI